VKSHSLEAGDTLIIYKSLESGKFVREDSTLYPIYLMNRYSKVLLCVFCFILKVALMILVRIMPIFFFFLYISSDCPWREGRSAACSPTLSGMQRGRQQQRRMQVRHDPACQENLIEGSFIVFSSALESSQHNDGCILSY
jgi:hypothetical protein